MTPAEEQALLRFPGSVRRGSPGITADLLRRQVECVVVSVTATHAVVSFDQVWEGHFADGSDLVQRYTVERRLEDIALDLTDATARAHLAWWLAEQTTEPEGAFAALWYGTPDGSVGQRVGIWRLSFRSLSWPLSPSSCGQHVYTARDCPTLASLDSDDARMLPDCSRLVDALALSLVARHVAGLEVKS